MLAKRRTPHAGNAVLNRVTTRVNVWRLYTSGLNPDGGHGQDIAQTTTRKRLWQHRVASYCNGNNDRTNTNDNLGFRSALPRTSEVKSSRAFVQNEG